MQMLTLCWDNGVIALDFGFDEPIFFTIPNLFAKLLHFLCYFVCFPLQFCAAAFCILAASLLFATKSRFCASHLFLLLGSFLGCFGALLRLEHKACAHLAIKSLPRSIGTR